MNLLYIPDTHASPDYDNSRFLALGKYIVDTKPDVIVQAGDFADMPSLSSYDRGTVGFEGRRYRQDVVASRDALQLLEAPTQEYNKRRRANKKSLYLPRKELTLGNHEHRIVRAVNSDPKLEGSLGVEDLGFEEFGWNVTPFKKVLDIEGISFRHFRPTAMGRAQGGNNLAASLLRDARCSTVVGHSHLWEIKHGISDLGKRMFALVGGCFVHPDFSEGWAAGTDHAWWRGVTLLEDVKDGYFGKFSRIPMKDIVDGNY